MTFIETIHQYLLIWRYRLQQVFDKSAVQYLRQLHIMTKEETVRYIIDHQCSCARLGDGEFSVIDGGGNGFQQADEKLGERLQEVLTSCNPNVLVCIPSSLKVVKPLVLNSQLSAMGYRQLFLKSVVMPHVLPNRKYGDALFTRFYMVWKNKRRVPKYITLLKQLWEGEDLLIVEGKYSRLGVGNDLFDNAASIKRILCPNQNAFVHYDEILYAVKSHYDGRLVILALGMTATVMAYDLANDGIRALDLGHIDVEYEWFRMGAKHKVAVPNKQVQEVEGGLSTIVMTNEKYLRQIVTEIE